MIFEKKYFKMQFDRKKQFCFLPFLGFTQFPTLNFTYFELTGLARHEILDRTKVAPRRKTLLPLILLFRCSAGGIIKLFICYFFKITLRVPGQRLESLFLMHLLLSHKQVFTWNSVCLIAFCHFSSLA